MTEHQVNVRYMVDDVEDAVDWYTKNLDFKLLSSKAPAFADVERGPLRLLLSGEKSSAGQPMPDGTKPGPGGWNRIELVVSDLSAEVERLRKRVPPLVGAVADIAARVLPSDPVPRLRDEARGEHARRRGLDPNQLGLA